MKSNRLTILIFILSSCFSITALASANNVNANLLSKNSYDISACDQQYLTSVAYNGVKVLVAVGAQGTICRSSDNGQTWRLINSGINQSQSLYGITYGDHKFVAVGDGMIMVSRNGIVWKVIPVNASYTLFGITYGNGKFVAVGGADNAVILTSRHGIKWIPSLWTKTKDALMSVVSGDHKFVAVGDPGQENPAILISKEGRRWLRSTATSIEGSLTGIAYDKQDNRFVAVGDNGVLRSDDGGLTWTVDESSELQSLQGVAYGKGMFVAVGLDGKVFTSTNGENWQPVLKKTKNALFDVVYGYYYFLAVGEKGTIIKLYTI
ncbi:MAG: hypothetical protein AAGA27_08435 [Pseudomonadota bacterium]